MHISWFVAAFSMGLICGVALCLVVSPNIFAGLPLFLLAGALFLISIIRRPRLLLVAACLSGILIGLARGNAVLDDFVRYEEYYGKEVVVQGTITEDVSYGKNGEQRLRINDVRIMGERLDGEVWVSLRSEAPVKRGDQVTITGKISEGFGNIQASVFRANIQQIVHPKPGDIGRQFRDWFAAGVDRAIPQPQASLGVGYLLGQKSALPETLEEQIRIAGLTHVVVASGYNLMILVVFARKLLVKISKYMATFAGSTMIVGFVLITGLSPSMSRAGLVAGLGLLAWYYGRRFHPLILLPLAAAVTLVIKPAYIWGDVGWFLSFAAFFGILVLAPLLHSYFWGVNAKSGPLGQLIIATFSAQLATLPIIMYVFGQYSLYALLANLLVLPVVPFSMLFTFLAGLAGLMAPAIATVIGAPATLLLKYCTFIIERIAQLPNAQGEVNLGGMWLAWSYGLMIILGVFLWRKTRHNFRLQENSSEVV